MRSVLFLLACLVALLGPPPASALELRMLMAWDDSYPGVRYLAERFARKIDLASHSEVSFALTGPDSIPAFEQLLPVSLGIFDLLLTHGQYHLETTAVGYALDALDATPAALRSAGVWDAVDRAYQAHGLKLIALPVGRAGYQLFLREPLGPDCSLRGRRIRAAPGYDLLLAALGATPMALPIGDAYAALRAKRLDGAAWSSVGALPFKWFEVTRYLMRPSFGAATHLLLMNLDTWQHLPLDLQRLLLDEGARLEDKADTRFRKLAARELNDLTVAGMQVSTLCEREARQLPRYWATGVWRIAEQKSGDEVRQLHALAQKAGFTP